MQKFSSDDVTTCGSDQLSVFRHCHPDASRHPDLTAVASVNRLMHIKLLKSLLKCQQEKRLAFYCAGGVRALR